ncbi:TPA: hypothetical protein N0F65_005024 [Lagenidium giganteum]|uniref:Uncharacterized protein n=1 Tax=Lagenidium giganteum TaxID=4803 RepID=A0AAV2ZLB5_9STRA|nr:TPA: hypothetical protein N0F65_005024 [Lagenidium giganteum]
MLPINWWTVHDGSPELR